MTWKPTVKTTVLPSIYTPRISGKKGRTAKNDCPDRSDEKDPNPLLVRGSMVHGVTITVIV
jgi:hypothetical protein